ncbi:MAG: thiamine phosphate synthase [Candidatus Dormibacteraeota bacterium]|nr:thiamine phosphate synthase [Candidatus Dormibacteraeota bacterium]MBO0744357.1 thiamine phosphate synthase [Candidatus Dormibacteraeota bacterium]
MAVVRTAEAGLCAVERGATILQLRQPGATAGELAAHARRLANESPVPVVVSGRADLALALRLGIHLPERDLPVSAVRRLLPWALIGCSVHDQEGALAAARGGADYVVLGPVFPTPTHPGAAALGVERFRDIAAQVSIPVLAIGGMDAGRGAALGGAGYAAIRAFAVPPDRE